MFNRDIKSRLDLIKPSIVEQGVENTVTKFSHGERVAARDYSRDEKWQFGRIKEVLGKLNYTIELDDGRTWKRHSEQIRKIGECTPQMQIPLYKDQSITEDEDDKISLPTEVHTEGDKNSPQIVPQPKHNTIPENPLRRSNRIRKPPSRLDL